MPIAINRNTTQAPMTVGGRTGEQVVKFIPASRVYVKTPDSQSSAPVQNYYSVSDGNVPAGWIDLGVISGGVSVKYNQKVDQVTTGIDNYMRSAYLASKDAELSFSLSQFDDVVISTLSGITPVALPNNVGYSWGIGSTDLVKLAVLMVSQDKLTGKEFQFYNPCVYVSFQFDYQSQALELKCTGYVPFFTPVGSDLECLFCVTIYSPASAQAGTYVMSFANRTAVTIPHMLGTVDIVPTYIDSGGFYVEYGDFQIIDANNGLMTFSQPVSGYITIASYGLGTGFSFNFSNQSTVTVTHNLGTTAIGAIVYDSSNKVVQYTSLTAVDSNNAQVVFSIAESGRVLVYKL